ncbi:RES family NAD+ phosphorylase [Pseudomonas sp. GZD-222]|uniref:RES family NAD+ phosphorylase n=1 Tax=Pseudomonas sp. GZD-222 TaxID=3404805 RepID=UPI003BB6C3F6
MADTPQPEGNLQLSTLIWAAGTPIHRVHLERYGASQFNPGLNGNARFSPIRDANGQPIPTLYGGTSFDCAAMETVFHDVPFAAGFKTYDKGKLAGQQHALLHCSQDLLLVDLGSKALRKLGVARKALIDTEKDQYPLTRQWAEAIHRQRADVQGLCWTSRQDDSARALMLFGDRVVASSLAGQGQARSLLQDSAAYLQVLQLAEQIGVLIVAGRS